MREGLLIVSTHATRRFRKRVAPVPRRAAMAALASVVEQSGCTDDGREHWIDAAWCGSKRFTVICRGTVVLTVLTGRKAGR